MSLQLYAHPFSSYCQKVLIALYENGTPFEWRALTPETPQSMAELTEIWPMKRFPVLVDDGRPVIESTVIIEHLGLFHPGPVRLIPDDPRAALETRWMDRFFDNYCRRRSRRSCSTRCAIRNERDARGVADARAMLDTSYAFLDRKMATREWAAGDAFSLADCGAAPFLFYADWCHRIGDALSERDRVSQAAARAAVVRARGR